MPSDKLTVKGLVTKPFEPHASITETGWRKQARFTLIASAGLAIASLVGGIVIASLGIPSTLVVGTFLFFAAMAGAFVLGKTKQHNIGSGLLSGGIAVWGFIFASTFPQWATPILLATIIPGLVVTGLLLPVAGVAIYSFVTLIAIGLQSPAMKAAGSSPIPVFAFLVVDVLILLATYIRNNIEDERLEGFYTLRKQLEQQVDERTRNIRIAAEIAQDIAESSTSEELMRQTVNLIVGRLGFHHAAIYSLDESGQAVKLRATIGAVPYEMPESAQRRIIGSSTIIGWAIENKKLRVITSDQPDPLGVENEFIPESRAEVCFPVVNKGQLLGALDVQSTNPGAFDSETLVTLQTLVNQIAIAIHNVHLFESEQVNIQEAADVYRLGYKIPQAGSEEDIRQIIQDIFRKTSCISFFLLTDADGFHTVASSDPQTGGANEMPASIPVTPDELEPSLATGIFIGEGGRLSSLPYSLLRVIRRLLMYSIAIIPVLRNGKIYALFLIGTREKHPLVDANIQPYIDIAKLIALSLDRIQGNQDIEHRLTEMETIGQISQEISSIRDLSVLYRTLHTHIRQTLGNINFLIALYDEGTNSISVPYMFERGLEGGDVTSIETFPLGEGLTSILIRTKQPLMLVEDTERRAAALGAKVVGKSAKSWLGTPLIVSGEVIGAVIVQDAEHEHAFNDNDLRLLTTLASQVAGAILNARLLEETRGRALQLQTAAEIARDISGSLELSELLNNAVNLIRDRFNFYHAAIFLVDAVNEFAIIREATGEAGMQMKRANHKLKVGSKSIVGYVTGSGEPLIVNDTSRDATYYANPLMPDTRAEVAIPLKVGPRVLGALDVQSSEPYSFGKEEISVLRILADQLAVAVINSELFADTQEHLSQHRLLHHVTTAAASGTTLEEALNSAAQGLQVTLGGDRVVILLADKTRQVLVVKATSGYSEEVSNLEVPFGEGITGWVAVHQQPQRISDVTKDQRYISVGSNVRSELSIPLSYRNELLGVLNVESDRIGAYTENDEELLGTLGGSLAAIIANARLIEQVRRQVDRERLLYEVTSKIRRSSDMQTIMATTATELSKALGARRAQIKIDLDEE